MDHNQSYKRLFSHPELVAEDWTERRKREGLEKGLQQGCEEGEAALLLQLLEHRFGAVSEGPRSRVQAADPETLLRWGRGLLTAGSLEEPIEE